MLILLVFIIPGVAGCDYARMYDQASIQTYERKMPEIDGRTVPIREGFEALSTADPRGIKNPLAYTGESVDRGRLAYTYFCIHCHGPKADGNGTVGQSFVPLCTDLASRAVKQQGDGEVYAKIRLGFKRHPKLFDTIPAEETWAVIIYVRSLKARS